MERTLFDQPARARNTDPSTSHEAAAKVTASGKADSQQAAIYQFLLKQTEPLTAVEIAAGMGIDRYIVNRRLPEMRPERVVNGPKRECRVNKSNMQTWRVR